MATRAQTRAAESAKTAACKAKCNKGSRRDRDACAKSCDRPRSLVQSEFKGLYSDGSKNTLPK